MPHRGRGRGRSHGAPSITQGSEEVLPGPPRQETVKPPRSQRWREEQNERTISEFQIQNQEKLKSNLFAEFDSLSDALRTVSVQPQAYTIRLSFTNRGVGLTLFQVLARVAAQCPELDLPVHSFYRVSLLQLAAQFDESQMLGDIGFIERLNNEVFCLLDVERRNLVKTNPLNFTPVSGIINCCGRFSVGDVKYVPSIASEVTPFTIHGTNLRQVVRMLADVETPIEVRQSYFRYNSIPGLLWDGELNPVVVNADDVIPADYDERHMRNDFMLVKSCLAKLGRKMPKMVGSVKFDGKGSAGQLMSAQVDANSPRINAIGEFAENAGLFRAAQNAVVGDIKNWSTTQRLTQEQVVCGALLMSGEYQMTMPAEYVVPWSSNRNVRGACVQYTFSRENVVSGLIG